MNVPPSVGKPKGYSVEWWVLWNYLNQK
jgi:hypothetical protein